MQPSLQKVLSEEVFVILRSPVPRVLDCGYSLVGALKFVEYLCCNEGLSAGTFCVIPRSQWPPSG